MSVCLSVCVSILEHRSALGRVYAAAAACSLSVAMDGWRCGDAATAGELVYQPDHRTMCSWLASLVN